MNSAELVVAAARFLTLGGAMFLWGAALYLAAGVSGPMRGYVWQRLTPLRRLALAGLVLALIVGLPAHAVVIAGDWARGLDPALMWRVATATTIGTSWLVQVGFTLLLLLIWRRGPIWTALGSAGVLLGQVMTGHAASGDGVGGFAHQAADLLHMLTAGAWFGALVPLAIMLAGVPDGLRAQRIPALIRFSTAGHVIVALVFASGLTNAALVLDSLWLDPGVPYQALILTKIAVFGAMVVLAFVNRYVVVPRLRHHHGAERALTIGTVTEIGLATLALLATAFLGMLNPTG